MSKKKQPQAAEGGSVFDRSDDRPADTDSDQVQTSPATAAAVPASEPPTPPRGAVQCNACSSADLIVHCVPVAPGWVQCPLCRVKQRNLSSLKAAMRGRGGKPRTAR